MTKKNKISTNYKKQIQLLLKKKPRGMSVKELSRALEVNKNTYQYFRTAIEQLTKEGTIQKLRSNKKYILPPRQKPVVGELRLTRGGYGFVISETEEVDVFVSKDKLNTAFDRDTVEVTLYARSRGKRAEGYISKVLKRYRTQYVGTFHSTEYYGFVVPDDQRIYRDFFIPKEKQLDAKDNQKVVVKLIQWKRDKQNPEGEIVDIIGFAGEAGVDVSSVAYSYQLSTRFNPEIEKKAKTVRAGFSENDLKDRLDLRELTCFTIDPADAKDFDDAVSLEKLENNNWQLGVHIADVSHYVRQGSKLDEEALARSTSVYLVDRVIPMLPERLSNDLCSLRPNEDRLTFTCFMEVTGTGEVVDYTIKPSVIHSKRRFSYEDVHEIIESKADDNLRPVLENMVALSKTLTHRRLNLGGIDFETPEVRFTLNEKGIPVNIERKVRLDSHRMIEEFMLLANQTVAAHIDTLTESPKKPLFIYRVHERPDKDKITRFFDFLNAIGHKVNPVKRITSKAFQTILSEMKGTPEELVIDQVALRSMMKAVYSTKNVGHFGLGFRHYTHFTSPIRRYPDLMVHRMLKWYDGDGKIPAPGLLAPMLKKVCDQSTRMERNALDAERESIRLKQTEYIAGHVGEQFRGVISGVMAFGIFVSLLDTLVEGLVQIADIEDDYFIYDEATFSMTGRDTNRVLRLGDEVQIEVSNVNLEEGKVDFKLLPKN